MLKRYNNFKIFLIGYIFFLVPALYIIINSTKGDTVIWFNSNATSLLDSAFQIITYFGLGGFFAIPIAIFLFIKYSHSIAGTISLILTGLFTYLFKQILFPDMLRPKGVLINGELTNFIEGFDYHITNSFPSGHTMTAFALFSFLAVIIKNKYLAPIFLICAVLIGISRMYLLQHFLIDVTVGSALGIISTILGFVITKSIFKNKPQIMDGNLLTTFREQ